MMKRCITLMSVVVFGLLFVAGCGGEGKKVDPYAEVSLEQATRGPVVVSKGFRYKLKNPQVVEMNGHLLLVREGNIMEIIAGRSIADKLEGLDPTNIEFNVVKKFSPYVHFKCEQVVSGEDTVFISQAGSIDYPRIVPVADFRTRDHDDYDIDRLKWNRTADLRKAVDKQLWVAGTVALIEEEGDEVWILSGDRGAAVRIVDPTDGVTIILRQLLERGGEFEGGITFTEVEPWNDRKNNHICGDIEIDYVRFLDKIVGS
jgi:hypothetical protein